MAQDQNQDIELGITRLEYGDRDRPQRGVLTICTGKYYNGGVISDATVYWVGRHSRQNIVGLGVEGDYRKRLMVSDRGMTATQRNIDRQHAETFTPEVIERITEAAKAHYARFVRDGIDGHKNVYVAEVAA